MSWHNICDKGRIFGTDVIMVLMKVHGCLPSRLIRYCAFPWAYQAYFPATCICRILSKKHRITNRALYLNELWSTQQAFVVCLVPSENSYWNRPLLLCSLWFCQYLSQVFYNFITAWQVIILCAQGFFSTKTQKILHRFITYPDFKKGSCFSCV